MKNTLPPAPPGTLIVAYKSCVGSDFGTIALEGGTGEAPRFVL